MISSALVLSGGGAKGAFSAGVVSTALPALEARGLVPDLVVGTSTGALIAPLAFTRSFELLRRLYTSQTTPDVLTILTPGLAFASGGLADNAPLLALARETVTPEVWAEISAQVALGRELMVTSASLTTGELMLFHVGTNIPDGLRPVPGQWPRWQLVQVSSREHFIRAMVASACEPARIVGVDMGIEFRTDRWVTRDLDGIDNERWEDGKPRRHQLVDGGIRTIAPVGVARAAGATRILLVSAQPTAAERARPARSDGDPTGPISRYGNAGAVLFRLLGVTLDRVLQADEEAGLDLGAGFQSINPDPPLQGDSLQVIPTRMADWLLQGREQGRAWVAAAPPPWLGAPVAPPDGPLVARGGG